MNKKRITQQTLRLTLRPFKRGDEKHVFAWAGDEEVAKYMIWNAHKSIEETKAFVKSVLDGYAKNPYHWVIVWNQTGLPIGSIGVQPNFTDKACEVGYCLRRDFWRRGIMTEALTAALSFLMYEEGFEIITASHNILNPNSGKVMQKCGMKYIGNKKIFIESKNQEVLAEYYQIKKL